MPELVEVVAQQADVARPKICQMVPTTFHGISSGSASMTRQGGDAPAFARRRQRHEDAERDLDREHERRRRARLRHSAAKKRPPSSVEGSSSSWYQPTPFQKNCCCRMYPVPNSSQPSSRG